MASCKFDTISDWKPWEINGEGLGENRAAKNRENEEKDNSHLYYVIISR